MLREARGHVVAALAAADGMYPPIRALQDDVAAAEAQAADGWRQAEEALAERRYTAAAVVLEVLVGVARDTSGSRGDAPEDLLARARAEVVRADDRCRAADGLRGADRELALLAVLDAVADHEAARRELAAVGVAPATEVAVTHAPGGRRIAWRPSLSPGPVDYRVLRVAPDGSRRTVGRTRSTSLEDGARDEVAGYVVIASRAGIDAPEASGSATARPMPAAPRPPRGTPSPPRPVPGIPAVESLTVAPHGRRIRLVFPPPPGDVTAEVRRLPAGALPPTPGSVVEPDELGTPVPGMAPGLAVDGRPSATVTHYVVLTRSSATAVAGASAAFVTTAPATGAELAGGRLRWAWPVGCTEAVVVFGRSEPPSGPADPETVSRRITNARYEIDDGVAVPDGHRHAAVFTCLRVDGRLHVSSEAPPGARAQLA
jgi:hypothetical protein